MSIKFRVWPAVFVLVALSGCGDDAPGSITRARPVTIQRLDVLAPAVMSRVTGVAVPYQQSDLSFEVPGKLEYVVDVGTEVLGKEVVEDGSLLLGLQGVPVQAGAVIARLEPERHEQALRAAELKLVSAKLAVKAQEIDVTRVSSEDIASVRSKAAAAAVEINSATDAVAAAKSAYDLAATVLRRHEKLVKSGAVSQSKVDQSRDTLEAARSTLGSARNSVALKIRAKEAADAEVKKALGTALLKQSQVEQARAQVKEQEVALAQAQADLDDCVMRAPFSGRVTAVHLGRGSFVQSGNSVVTLTLLNPIQISVAVSAEDDRRLFLGAPVQVRPISPPVGFDVERGLSGVVFEKNQIADPGTGTFKVQLIVPNQETKNRVQVAGQAVAVADWLFPIVQRSVSGRAGRYVNVRCLLREGDRTYVLHVPDEELSTLWSSGKNHRVLHPLKVEVDLGGGFFELVNWRFRELRKTGGLPSGATLVGDPREEQLAGVVLGRRERAFRPGDLVRVDLNLGSHPEGLYVPVIAVRERNGSMSVFLVEGVLAREVPVTVHESYGELRRIEGPGIEAGAQVVVKGAHFLADGDTVSLVESGR